MAAPAPQAAPAIIASSADTGPLSFITSDSTCGSWDNIQTVMASAQKNGWAQRDTSIPGSAWDPAHRAPFEAVGNALRSSADQAVTLAAQTPHRAMRELYEAFIAYGRAYADALPNYQPADDALARTSLAALDSITNICAASKSITAMAAPPAVPAVAPPTTPPILDDVAQPQRFLPQAGPMCTSWIPAATALQAQTQDWSALDPEVAVGQWDTQERLVQNHAAQVFTTHASDMETAGRASSNPVIEDFAALGATYFRAFAIDEPLYWQGDHDLADVGFSLDHLITAGCQAAS